MKKRRSIKKPPLFSPLFINSKFLLDFYSNETTSRFMIGQINGSNFYRLSNKIYLYTYINVGGNYERKPNRSARASTIRYRSTRCMHQRKEPLSSFVPFFRLLFFFPSFFFPFLSPSFISCPPSCSPRQPFSFFLLFLFFFSFTRATVHGIIDGAMNTRTPLRFFRVTPSVTLPPSFVFNFLPRLPFTVR